MKRSFRPFLCALLAALLFVSLLPVSAKASTVLSVSGDLDAAKPTKDQITARYHDFLRLYRTENSYDAFVDNWSVHQTKNAAYGEVIGLPQAYREQFYTKGWDATYAEDPSIAEPYAIGALSETVLEAGIAYLNFARYLAGVPAAKLDAGLITTAQTDSWAMAKAHTLDHAAGGSYGGAESIARSAGDLGTTLLEGNIQAWLDDTGSVDNISGVGHRAHMLSTDYPYYGFGVTFASDRNTSTYESYATCHSHNLYEIPEDERLSVRYDFVSWPASGNFPTQLMGADVPWSVDLNGKYSLMPDFQVQITRKSDGRRWYLDEETGEPNTNMKLPYLVRNGNHLVFHLGTENVSQYAGVYTVYIAGIRDQQGNSVTVEYSIDFFDMESYGLHNYNPNRAEVTDPCCRNYGFTINTCTTCGNVNIYDYKEQLPHQWTDPTCAAASTCTSCGLSKGLPLPHSYTPATCITPQTCSVCGYFDPLDNRFADHAWQAATCAAPKTCSVCGLTEGEPLDHYYAYNPPHNCLYCGQPKPTDPEDPNDPGASETPEDPNNPGSSDTPEDPNDPGTSTDPETPGGTPYIRLAGETRYETAFAAADALKKLLGVEKFQNIIVASGEEFADALAGSYLAAVKDAPILLVKDRNKEIHAVRDYIHTNLAPGGTVYLLGGEKAVSKRMEQDLEEFTLKRLGGATRYETNLLILQEAGAEGQALLVCTGKEFADSLSVSAVGLPILLVKDSLTEGQKQFLSGHSGKIYIIGGQNAISARMGGNLIPYGTVARIAGDTRYETSVAVAKEFFQTPSQVVVAYGQNFPDGLSGGPVANRIGAPLLLTRAGKEVVAGAYVTETGISSGYVLGGTTVLAEKTVNKVFGIS